MFGTPKFDGCAVFLTYLARFLLVIRWVVYLFANCPPALGCAEGEAKKVKIGKTILKKEKL